LDYYKIGSSEPRKRSAFLRSLVLDSAHLVESTR